MSDTARYAICTAILLTLAFAATAENKPMRAPETVDIFVAGNDGVDTYRIPSLLVVPDGSLLAFCEARKQSMEDASPTDMVLKRSMDSGRTWSPMQTILQGGGNEAIMNPCPVFDSCTSTLFLFCVNAHKIREDHHVPLLLASADFGRTWSKPEDIAERISAFEETFVPGPGIGIQMQNGRLVIPGYAGEFDNETKSGYYSRVLYSDDHGAHWTMGRPVAEFTDESQVMERVDGTLMLNMRGDMGTSCRAVALSRDGGQTWADFYWDRALNECPCQAALLHYSRRGVDRKNRILFSNPDNAGEKFGVVERTQMTVRLSYDEGKTWPIKKRIHAGPSSYSGLVRLPDGDIGMVYEGGEKHRREWIRFVRFSLAWLTDGHDCIP